MDLRQNKLTKEEWCALEVPVDDKEKSDLINAHSNWKLGGSNIQAGMEEALELAFHLGTSFPKAIWRRSEESYERMATILVDAEGNGITGEDGEYFYIEDEEGGDEEENVRITPLQLAKANGIRTWLDILVCLVQEFKTL